MDKNNFASKESSYNLPYNINQSYSVKKLMIAFIKLWVQVKFKVQCFLSPIIILGPITCIYDSNKLTEYLEKICYHELTYPFTSCIKILIMKHMDLYKKY